MLVKLLILFGNFFYIGAFSFGGGNAMIPFIQQLVEKNGWMTASQFADMLAISQVTPGPIAINMATYVGFTVAGPLGSLMSTIAVCLPAFILISLVMGFILDKFKDSKYVKAVLNGLRPAVVGLIGVAIVNVSAIALVNEPVIGDFSHIVGNINYIAVIITITSLIAILRWKVHPVVCIIGAGVLGLIFF